MKVEDCDSLILTTTLPPAVSDTQLTSITSTQRKYLEQVLRIFQIGRSLIEPSSERQERSTVVNPVSTNEVAGAPLESTRTTQERLSYIPLITCHQISHSAGNTLVGAYFTRMYTT
jgi:hypothetical protein